MIALIQRVTEASVRVEACGSDAGTLVGAIGAGLLALVCAERHDTEREADRLLDRLLTYRVFSDDAGRMNRSLRDVGGQLLVVPQFTLAADTNAGTRPSFTPAAPAALGERLYDRFVQRARQALDELATPAGAGSGSGSGSGVDLEHADAVPDPGAAIVAGESRVATGRFGADMRVALVNDGPVTFWLRVPPSPSSIATMGVVSGGGRR